MSNSTTRSNFKSGRDEARGGTKQTKEPAETLPKLKDGLVRLVGFTEQGISTNCNILRYRDAIETFTQATYPKLYGMVANPSGKEYEVPIPDVLKRKPTPRRSTRR